MADHTSTIAPPDFSRLDYFKVFIDLSVRIEKLGANCTRAIRQIPLEMLERVIAIK